MKANNIGEVLAILDHIVADARARGSRLGYFAALYRQVTLEVQRGIEKGFFDNGERMDRFDTLFANRYFEALATWRAGGAPSRSWKVAFQAMEDPEKIILQDLLVGMNAHINLDLSVAAARLCPGDQIRDLHGDFMKINQILASMIHAVEVVIGRFSPLINVLDRLGGKDEAEVLNFSIDVARQDAWNHALILAIQPPKLQEITIDALDGKTSFLGRIIAHPPGVAGKAVELIRMMESRDVPAITDALNNIVH